MTKINKIESNNEIKAWYLYSTKWLVYDLSDVNNGKFGVFYAEIYAK